MGPMSHKRIESQIEIIEATIGLYEIALSKKRWKLGNLKAELNKLAKLD